MNPTIQRYLLSSLTTALTVGSAVLAMQLSAGPIEWTTTFWLTLGGVVLRAVWKAVVEGLAKQTADA